MANNPNEQAVVLIHGLYQTDWIMKPLADKLYQLGLKPYLYHYRTLREPLSVHSQRLYRFVKHANLQAPHFVTHSLGGLVIRQFLSDYNQFATGRIVTLGTPHNGSTVAHYVNRLLPLLIGQSYHNALDGRLSDSTPPNVELGVIAGNKAVGIMNPLLKHHHKKHRLEDYLNDGTVFVFETRLSWAKEHLILPVSHTGMLFDKEVAYKTVQFLTTGSFSTHSIPSLDE